jgi:hypothetical protein
VEKRKVCIGLGLVGLYYDMEGVYMEWNGWMNKWEASCFLPLHIMENVSFAA